MILKSLLFISLLTLSSLFADTSLTDAEFRGEAKAKITFLEKQNDELKLKLNIVEDKQKSVEDYKAIIERQDERISDFKETLSIILGVLGFFATIAGYLFYSKAQLNAKAEAQKWLGENSQRLKEKMEDLEKNIDQNKKSMKEKTEEYNKILKNASSLILHKQREIETSIDNKEEVNQKKKEEETFSFASSLIKQKPVSEYGFNEWNILAFDAYNKDKKEDAIFYWTKAIELGSPSEENTVVVLFNKGFTLGEINEHAKAIDTYDKLFETFKYSNNEVIKMHIAKALLSKGYHLSQMKEDAKAIKVFDKLLEMFKENSNETVKEQIAIACNNKGTILWKISESTKAIEIYNELLQTFKDTSNETIKKEMAKALLNIFEYLLINNKEWNDENINLFKQYGQDNKQLLLKFKMLEIVKNTLKEEQTLELSQLKKEFLDTSFGDWSWKELDTWYEKLEDEEAKKRVQQTIEVFKNWDKK